MAGLFKGALNARLHADHKSAVVLKFVLLAEDLGLGGVDLRDVIIEAAPEFRTDGYLLAAGGEQVDDLFQAVLVVEEEMAAREPNCIARDLGRDEGIAVAVAADPRAKVQYQGQLMRLNLEAVGGVQGIGDF